MAGNNESLKTVGNNRCFKPVGNNEGSKTAGNNGVKNCREVIVFQGFVKTVGNMLATLDLPREMQTASNALSGS